MAARLFSLIAVVTTYLLWMTASANALEFNVGDKTIVASGDIVDGDAEKLRRVIAAIPKDEMGEISRSLSLNSPGGSLLEGIRLGQFLRSARVPTLVEKNSQCYSACAIAFLGGTIQGATKAGIKRQLEFGAALGFHGFAVKNDVVKLENESIDETRLVNAIIIAYGSEMGGIDLGFFLGILNTPPSDIYSVRTPESISALGIELAQPALKMPRDWPYNACENTIRGELGTLDPVGLSSRVRRNAMAMRDLQDFKLNLLNDRFPPSGDNSDKIRASVTKLADDDAIDLLSGTSLFLSKTSGKTAVYRVPLERGAGFYADVCYAIAHFDSHEIQTIIVDGALTRGVTVFSRDELAEFPYSDPLW